MVDRCNSSNTGVLECKHDGLCTRTNTAAGFRCDCVLNYTGVNCEIAPQTPGHPHHVGPAPPPTPSPAPSKINRMWLAMLLVATLIVGCCGNRLMGERPRWCCPRGCCGLLPPRQKHDEEADSRQELRETLTEPEALTQPELEPQPDPTLHIEVCMLNGSRAPLAVQPTDTVERVKRMLYLDAGVPPVEQRLVCVGNELVDASTMEQSGVVDGSTIHLVLRLAEPEPESKLSIKPVASAPPAASVEPELGLDSSVSVGGAK